MPQITKDIATHTKERMLTAFRDGLGLCDTEQAQIQLSVICLMHVAAAVTGILQYHGKIPGYIDHLTAIEAAVELMREAKGGA